MDNTNILDSKFSQTLGYVDLHYKGLTSLAHVSYKESLLFEITDFHQFPSIYPYPLGNYNLVYPTGGAIPLLAETSRIKINIRWGNETGTSYLRFYTSNFSEIVYSGLIVQEETLASKSYIVTVPPEAKYMTFRTLSGELHLQEFSMYALYDGVTESPLVLKEAEAIKNAFKLWLFSSRGDFGRNIFKGGPVDTLLGMDLSVVGAAHIKSYLLTEISRNFANLTESDIEVIPSKKDTSYRVRIILKDFYNKFISPIELEVS